MNFSGAIRNTFSTRSLRDEMQPTGALDQLAGTGLVFAAILYLYFDLLGGMLRGTLAGVGLVSLLYLPAVLAIGSLAINALARIGDPRTSVATLCVIGFIVLETAIALLLGRSLAAALFALYIWLPGLVAMALTQRRMQDRFVDALIPVFYIATAGVLLNIFVRFPWADATYEVMGVQREAARQWSAGGMDRLAGFSRASVSAAAQILLGFCAIEHRVRSFVWRAILWTVGLVAIHFTTSKSPESAMLLLPLTYLVIGRIRTTGGARRQWLANAFLAFWMLFIFAGPFISMTFGADLYPNGAGVGRGYSSFADRVVNTWPNAIAMIDWRNPLAWLVGRGLGGIGTPQMMFEAAGNPADNVAIYLFASFGLASLVFVYLIFRGGQRAIASGDRGRRDFALIVAVLGIGSAANLIEGPTPVMALGLALARYRSRQRSGGAAEETAPPDQRRRRSGTRSRSRAGDPGTEQNG